MNETRMSRLKRSAYYAGISCIALAALLFLGRITGLVEFPAALVPGEDAVHSVARLAVIGCLLAAVGSLQTQRGEKDDPKV